jgi:hypothetical protein
MINEKIFGPRASPLQSLLRLSNLFDPFTWKPFSDEGYEIAVTSARTRARKPNYRPMQ